MGKLTQVKCSALTLHVQVKPCIGQLKLPEVHWGKVRIVGV
jgi:hypothetical protein